MMTKRREFIKKSIIGSAGIAIGGMGLSPKAYSSVRGANERINVAVIGIRNQGSVHINNWCAIKDSHNVVIKTLCDVDERLFSSRTKMVVDNPGSDLTDISYLSGYYDQSHFIKEIKKIIGVSPGNIRGSETSKVSPVHNLLFVKTD